MDFRTVIPAIPPTRRDRALNRALLNGSSLTSRHLLEADFGHFPPRGVNSHLAHDEKIIVRSPLTDPRAGSLFTRIFRSLMALGYVYRRTGEEPADKPWERAVHVNKILTSAPGRVGLGWFFGNTALKIAAGFKTFGAIGGLVFNPFLTILFASTLRNVVLAQMFSLTFRSRMDIVGHEHTHVLQQDGNLRANLRFKPCDENFRTALQTAQQGHFRTKLSNIWSFGLRNYFLKDQEIQARLHVVMAKGYQRWGRMPETRHELWAALIDSGLKAPKNVHEKLRQSRAGGVDATADFHSPGLSSAFNRNARRYTDSTPAELNMAHNAHITPSLKRHFWNVTLPYLYGHLLEIYGDEAGRNKMGFKPGTSPWAKKIAWNVA